MADAATGLLAAALAKAQGKPHQAFTEYADRHSNRALLPLSRERRIKRFFIEALGWADADDIPAGALEPLIDYAVSRLAHQINAYG